MKNNNTINDLLGFFPIVELPVTISEELVYSADAQNKVLHAVLIEQFIVPWEGSNIDEFTEFVPCIQLQETDEFYAIIYWKGGLLKKEYILVTIDKKGNMIARRPISTTVVEGELIKRSVGYIDEDMIIHIMAGENKGDLNYDPTKSQAFNMEIIYTGEIIFSLGND
ncbi:MAG: hypothetical protein V3V14_12805 [Saprospiraceae bacterium]